MMMTFVLTPLSHYNSIIEPHAQFLLSLLGDLYVDFPSHFITSILDIYQDMSTRDKLIFHSIITHILRHFSISIPNFYTVMGAISVASVRQSKAHLSGFAASPSPSLEASTDEDGDDDEDEDASSSNDDEMTTSW